MKTPGIFQPFVKTITATFALAALLNSAALGEDAAAGRLAKGPLKIFLLAGQSDMGFHYNGEGRFFILLGKQFADTMLELMRR